MGKGPSPRARAVTLSGERAEGEGGIDPMAGKWPDLGDHINRNVPWKVAYVGPNSWTFQVTVKGGDTKLMLSEWFCEMKEAIKKLEDEEYEARITDEDRKNEADWHAQEMERRRIRLPQNPAEEEELKAEAQKSPQAFYAWVYNPEMAEAMKGKAWIHMGFETWEAGYKTLLDLARQDAKENEEEEAAYLAAHPAKPAPQNQKTPTPPPPAPAPSQKDKLLEGLDPDTRALVETEIAKGPLI